MDRTPASSYDLVPYVSHPYASTQPRHLAAVATLFGMTPPDVATARTLEIGCASGGNLLPMAESFPDAEFEGIDASARQIAEGQATLDALQLNNVVLSHQDVLRWDAPARGYDFIICHGVFSWVPQEVQERILSFCRDHLTPQGVAYVSYNTYPGWYLRRGVRDMMNYHAAGFDQTQEKIDQSRALLNFLASAASSHDGAYSTLLQSELDIIGQCDDSYLFHEHLEECNEPMYFFRFVELAEQFALRFLAEAHFGGMLPHGLSPEARETLTRIAPGLVQMEQYLDFLRNRKFRQTLLCHASVKLDRSVEPERMAMLAIACPLKQVAREVAEQDAVSVWEHPSGKRMVVRAPAEHAMFSALVEAWPGELPFSELLQRVQAAVQGLPPGTPMSSLAELRGELLATLLECFSQDLVNLASAPSATISAITDRPEAQKVARLMAQRGERVTTARHQTARLSDFDRALLQALDGTRDKAALIALLKEHPPRTGPSPEGTPRSPESLADRITAGLERLRQAGLLVG